MKRLEAQKNIKTSQIMLISAKLRKALLTLSIQDNTIHQFTNHSQIRVQNYLREIKSSIKKKISTATSPVIY